MNLYHFTCRDGRKAIGKDGTLKPKANPLLGAALIWLTEEPRPSVDSVGLTRNFITCDRTEFRYVAVDPRHAVRWDIWKERLKGARIVEILESYAGDGPRKWWVSERPLRARLAPCGGRPPAATSSLSIHGNG